LGGEDARIRVTVIEDDQPLDGNFDLGELARSVLADVLNKMDIQAEIIAATEPSADAEDTTLVSLDIEGDDLGILIGRRGQTLSALQYLVRLIVAHKTHAGVSITIDVEGYKAHRYEALKNLAIRMADQVKARRAPFTLEPMPPYERRIIHLALVDNPDVITYSIGEGESRKVVIAPKERTMRRQ